MRSTIRLWLAMLGVVTCCLPLSGSVNLYTSEAERSPHLDYHLQEKTRQAANERQEQFRKRVSIQHAVGDNVPFAFARGPAQVATKAVAKPLSDAQWIVLRGVLLVFTVALILAAAVRILAPEIFKAVIKRLMPWTVTRTVATVPAANVRAEEKAFEEFLATFQTGSNDAADANAPVAAGDFREEFYIRAARLIASQRALLENIGCSAENSARHRMLGDLLREMNEFKTAANAPEFLPAWQLASALEGLLKQLSTKAGDVTQSTLRTVSGALDLLGELCDPDVRADIVTNPPLKFLAVDDDMICRTAVSMALKKAFNQPDLADNGVTALGLAETNAYDLVFLDVQMPGMDGYELCAKIHEIPANKQTPVVFVTCMTDFEARAQSVLAGGSDLIGKPFLTFEITVKALTLAIGRRLRIGGESLIEPGAAAAGAKNISAPTPQVAATETTNAPQTAATSRVESRPAKSSTNTDQLSRAMLNPVARTAGDDGNEEARDPRDEVFLSRAATQINVLKDHVRSISEAMDETTRQELLGEFFLGLHGLSPETDPGLKHPAMRVCSALEGLTRKLLERPENWTPSMLLTLTNAVDLMGDLCAADATADVAPEAAIRILAVDDDPISRRAVVGALQMSFEKPESAESGEAALALATEKPFDLIFMDVVMPGMDGFEACSGIRLTQANAATPVVFVTGQADAKARQRAESCGGNGFIAKPFLKAEVTVIALTFALRGRIKGDFAPGVSKEVAAK